MKTYHRIVDDFLYGPSPVLSKGNVDAEMSPADAFAKGVSLCRERLKEIIRKERGIEPAL